MVGGCWMMTRSVVLAVMLAVSAGVAGADSVPTAKGGGVSVIVPSGVGAVVEWRYVTTTPEADWIKPGFDDSAWQTGPAGFGTAQTPNTHVRTEWTGEDIWLRRTFELKELPGGECFLNIHHDEDADVFFNGVKAATVGGFNNAHELVAIAADALRALKVGANTIAVHCHQTSGGQYIDLAVIQSTLPRWSRQRAEEWYRRQPWLCGYNYVPANAISYTEMFMPYNFDPALIERELKLSQEIGFNCMRVVLPFVVWEHDPVDFKRRLETFLGLCQKHGLRLMPALFDDCGFGPVSDPVYGQQPEVVVGWYANGWTPSPGHTLGRDVAQWSRLRVYVQDIIRTFRDDPRILAWDLYNEPMNGVGEIAIPLVDLVFDWAREVDPAQPLTVGLFGGNANLNRLCLLRSDIVTFHNYGPPAGLEAEILKLQAFGRPVICTEWLNRPLNSTVAGCLPVFQRTHAGCMHWGLVNGKTQTHLAWGWRPGRGEPEKWQHDLYHGDYRPYDPAELDLFRAALRKVAAAESTRDTIPPDER